MSWLTRFRNWLIHIRVRHRIAKMRSELARGRQSETARIIDAYTASQRSLVKGSLDLAGYRETLSRVERPTNEQMLAFAEYVASAHSWYKHLPLIPPGDPFVFYLDPQAGMDLVVLEDGRIDYLERREGDDHMHYNWRPTSTYRRSFGHLAYATESGTMILQSISLHAADGTKTEGMIGEKSLNPVVYVPDRGHYTVPSEVVDSGTVELTGVIHSGAIHPHFWEFDLLHRQNEAEPYWPKESGGAEALDKILMLCGLKPWNDQIVSMPRSMLQRAEQEIAQMRESEGDKDLPEIKEWAQLLFAKDELPKLLKPERARLLREMVGAMGRVVDLVF